METEQTLSGTALQKAVNWLIRHRRSVFPKQFSGEPVPRHIIDQMLENANWAPTHGRTEPWRFFVFSGPSLESFARFQAGLYKEETPAENFDQGKFEKLLENPKTASHIIAICMKRQASGKIPEIEEIEAVACAVQNMYLTATAYNVGAYWASGGVTYMEAAKEFFGLSANDRLLGFFYVGQVAVPSPDGQRGDAAAKVTWVD